MGILHIVDFQKRITLEEIDHLGALTWVDGEKAVKIIGKYNCVCHLVGGFKSFSFSPRKLGKTNPF